MHVFIQDRAGILPKALPSVPKYDPAPTALEEVLYCLLGRGPGQRPSGRLCFKPLERRSPILKQSNADSPSSDRGQHTAEGFIYTLVIWGIFYFVSEKLEG